MAAKRGVEMPELTFQRPLCLKPETSVGIVPVTRLFPTSIGKRLKKVD